jgi:ActR/RegA family two-component response regulator
MDKQVLLNKKLTEIIHKLEGEVGGLLGQDFSCEQPTHSFTNLGALLGNINGKAVLSMFEVSGDTAGTAYLVVELKDAISLGGTLILLPPDEMNTRRKSELFDGEVSDAFGEIANIIAGVYTAVFIEHANPKLHFKKTELIPFNPTGDDIPIPEGVYYTTTGSIVTDGNTLGALSVLIPPDLLGLEAPTTEELETTAETSPTPPEDAGGKPATAKASPAATAAGPPLILVVSETQQAAEFFAQNFSEQCNCEVTCMHFQGDFQLTARNKNVVGVFLAMREVGERGLASIIKIQSAVGEKTPLIAAGPAWTRQTVLQAVKYGASDILVTPASKQEVLEKIHQHMQVPTN